jgi:hypothetical protein
MSPARDTRSLRTASGQSQVGACSLGAPLRWDLRFSHRAGNTSVRPANNLRKRATLSAAGEPLVTVAASVGGGEGSCSLSISCRRLEPQALHLESLELGTDAACFVLLLRIV